MIVLLSTTEGETPNPKNSTTLVVGHSHTEYPIVNQPCNSSIEIEEPTIPTLTLPTAENKLATRKNLIKINITKSTQANKVRRRIKATSTPKPTTQRQPKSGKTINTNPETIT
ncbi:hypothetical protein SOVF_102040 [Spinacia oleracea]|nr:hypothetical protein SOVF_102040 [Spinacia oleracea]